MEVNVKYKIGDTVYSANPRSTTKRHPCPDCRDTKIWTAISPAGTEHTFNCPRCSASYSSYGSTSLSYHWYEPHAEPLTIGSIRTDTHDKKPVVYMCEETGVGSGTLHDQETLFATEDEALAASQAIADKLNSETPRIVETYNERLRVSDYQLSNAVLDEARRERANLMYKISDLFEALDECESIEAVRAVIENEKAKDEQAA